MSDLISGTGGQDRYARYHRATADLDPPFAVVDLAAFDSNARDLVRRSGGVPIRVVSKSLRCRHLIERALAGPGYRGIMCYSLAEAIWLHSLGLSDDLLVSPDEPAAVGVPTYRGDGQCFG
jgi:D-serine deaminase-like pyridoxal phosphate-dependent protein